MYSFTSGHDRGKEKWPFVITLQALKVVEEYEPLIADRISSIANGILHPTNAKRKRNKKKTQIEIRGTREQRALNKSFEARIYYISGNSGPFEEGL